MITKKMFGQSGRIAVFIILLLCIVGPFLWLVNSSFQRRVELFSRPPTWLPSSLYLKNYVEVLTDPVLIHTLKNSLIISTFTTSLALVIGSLAAYAFTRFQFPAKKTLFLSLLATQMLPGMSLMIPLYMLLRSVKLIYTYQGLVVTYLTFSLPYVVWLLRSFFQSLPVEIEEAALVDGCTRWQAIWKVVVPLSMPGFISTGIFAFVGAWNEFMLASVLTNTATKTFPVKLAQFMGEESTAYEHMFAAAVLGTIPVLVLVLVFQKYIVKGLTEGGLK